MSKQINKVTTAGLVVALGIIYGDIGTSPLYVFNAIISDRMISEDLIIGSLSCIIWTITLQTTIKYVLLVLQADNRGEGGTFALSNAPEMAKAPRSLPEKSLSEPINLPTGVRAPATITDVVINASKLF